MDIKTMDIQHLATLSTRFLVTAEEMGWEPPYLELDGELEVARAAEEVLKGQTAQFMGALAMVVKFGGDPFKAVEGVIQEIADHLNLDPEEPLQ